MKYLVMFGAIGLGIIIGNFPGIEANKPIYWKIAVVALVAIACIMAFFPPIAGTFNDGRVLAERKIYNEFNVHFKPEISTVRIIQNENRVQILASTVEHDKPNKSNFELLEIRGTSIPDEFKQNETIVGRFKYHPGRDYFEYRKLIAEDPSMIFPYVPALDERARILVFHVPLAWIAVIAFCISMIYSIQYLKRKEAFLDIKASSAALMGLVFTFLATITGMVWAKFNWGSYWSWDPRQTSILVLMIIYFAYFALRSSINEPTQRARFSGAYSVIAFISAIFLVFILPRLQPGLHPGSQKDSNTGPVISPQDGLLDSSLLYSFGISLFAFILVCYWLMNLYIRYRKLEEFKVNTTA